MNISSWIGIILSSAFTSAVVNQAFNWWNERRKDENERYKILYGPLKFYFMHISAIDKQIDEVIKATGETINEETQILDSQRQQESIKVSIDSSTEVKNKLVTLWWKNVEKVYTFLENNPDKIKKGDIDTVGKFVDAYIATEYLGKDRHEKMDAALYRKLSDQREHISKVVKSLENKIVV